MATDRAGVAFVGRAVSGAALVAIVEVIFAPKLCRGDNLRPVYRTVAKML